MRCDPQLRCKCCACLPLGSVQALSALQAPRSAQCWHQLQSSGCVCAALRACGCGDPCACASWNAESGSCDTNLWQHDRSWQPAAATRTAAARHDNVMRRCAKQFQKSLACLACPPGTASAIMPIQSNLQVAACCGLFVVSRR